MKIQKKMHKVHIFFLSLLLGANFAFAQEKQTKPVSETKKAVTDLDKKTLQQFVADFFDVATKYILQLLLALTIFVFLYGLMKYMFKGQGSDTARSEGRKLMLWGVLGIFVITSIWGLVAIFASFVGHGSIVIPQF